MNRLAGKVALVTGAASGIGEASASFIGAEGASVVIADINLEGAEVVAETIRRKGGNATAVLADMGDEQSIGGLFSKAVELYGGVDIVHNNALGFRMPERSSAGRSSNYVHDYDPNLFDAMLHATVTAAMISTQHAIPLLTQRGGGSIINTASIAGTQGEVYNPAYGAGKAALIQLSKSTAAMYGRRGIRCNAVCPGFILTPAGLGAFDEDGRALWRKHTVVDRLGIAEDVAHLVVYLASDESEFMTGQALVIDGGFTMHEPMWADRLEREEQQ
jgi:NAD(P)-dependent dehydrogenase (short-subunit alcohol dehydrogenase family)